MTDDDDRFSRTNDRACRFISLKFLDCRIRDNVVDRTVLMLIRNDDIDDDDDAAYKATTVAELVYAGDVGSPDVLSLRDGPRSDSMHGGGTENDGKRSVTSDEELRFGGCGDDGCDRPT